MRDDPSAEALVDAVARFLRETAVSALSGHAAYQARVAAGVLDLVTRQLGQRGEDEAERARLQALLGGDGDLESLNRRLTEAIASGALTLETPGLADHLWRTTLAKMAVDQPGYASLRRIAENNG